MNIFDNFDFTDFWSDYNYNNTEAFTEDAAKNVEEILGYKLPKSYIDLMKLHNGGYLDKCCFPTEKSHWAEDHANIAIIMGIGQSEGSLAGDMGSKFWIEEWGYPDIGVYFGGTTVAGHVMIALDYRKCGKDGEPEVVSIDQESDYDIIFLAKDFETFIRGLVSEDMIEDLVSARTGQFSDVLLTLCNQISKEFNIESKIRALLVAKIEECGSFTLHSDDISMIVYDIQFWLYSYQGRVVDKDEYLIKDYKEIISFGTFSKDNVAYDTNDRFTCGAYEAATFSDWYEPSIISDWLETRIKEGRIIEIDNNTIQMSPLWITELEKSILEIAV